MKKTIHLSENEFKDIVLETAKQLIREQDEQDRHMITEMARIGFLLDSTRAKGQSKKYEIYIRTNDTGKIAHFHIMDVTTQGKEFHTCVCFASPKYFHHNGKEDFLNTKEKKLLMSFFKQKAGGKLSNLTNWEYAVFEWNKNNSDVHIDEDLEMPDYTLLPAKPNT